MDRRAEITKFIQPGSAGIEIAPRFNPLTPKREGYRCLTLDIFDSDTLRDRARRDPQISDDLIPRIEPVDLVGNTADLADLVPSQCLGTFDYVVSSHSFEHLPNPVAFLCACEKVLKPDGFYRWPSLTGAFVLTTSGPIQFSPNGLRPILKIARPPAPLRRLRRTLIIRTIDRVSRICSASPWIWILARSCRWKPSKKLLKIGVSTGVNQVAAIETPIAQP